MSLSAGRNLVPLAYSCQSGVSRQAHGSEASRSPPNPPSEQITAPAKEAEATKALSIIASPRRRREQEIDELEAEHRAEVVAKADQAEETKVEHEDDAARTGVDDVIKNHDGGKNTTEETKKPKSEQVIREMENEDVADEHGHDERSEEGKVNLQDEMRELTDISSKTIAGEENGRSAEQIEGQVEKNEQESPEQTGGENGGSTEQIEGQVEKSEQESPEQIQDETPPPANSIGYIPALLSKVFDEKLSLNCC